MGVFDTDQYKPFWTRYRATLQFREKLMGGIPRDPKLIEGWIRTKTGLIDNEMKSLLIRTLNESGVEVREEMTPEEIDEAASKIAGLKETTGLKRDEYGLFVEERQVKAMLKECVNVLYAGERVGPTKKGAKAYFTERVFVNPDRIYLGIDEPSGIEMIIGHVSGPQGPRSTLGYHEYALRPTVTFDVLVARDLIEESWWPDIWRHAQENGFGALRSQGHGRFDLVEWDRIALTEPSAVASSRVLAHA